MLVPCVESRYRLSNYSCSLKNQIRLFIKSIKNISNPIIPMPRDNTHRANAPGVIPSTPPMENAIIAVNVNGKLVRRIISPITSNWVVSSVGFLNSVSAQSLPLSLANRKNLLDFILLCGNFLQTLRKSSSQSSILGSGLYKLPNIAMPSLSNWLILYSSLEREINRLIPLLNSFFFS